MRVALVITKRTSKGNIFKFKLEGIIQAKELTPECLDFLLAVEQNINSKGDMRAHMEVVV